MDIEVVIFDVDGTLIDLGKYKNVWELLYEYFCVPNEVSDKLYKEYIRGETTYKEWATKGFRELVKRGANKLTLNQAIGSVRPFPTTLSTLCELRQMGKKLAIISGSMDFVVKKFFPGNLFDYMLLNKVYFNDSGSPEFDATSFGTGMHKAEGLKEICSLEGLSTEQCAFVGDGENDFEIFKMAGVSILFHPSEELWKRISQEKIAGRAYKINQEEEFSALLKIFYNFPLTVSVDFPYHPSISPKICENSRISSLGQNFSPSLRKE